MQQDGAKSYNSAKSKLKPGIADILLLVLCCLVFIVMSVVGLFGTVVSIPEFISLIPSFSEGIEYHYGNTIYYVESESEVVLIENFLSTDWDTVAQTDKGILKLRGSKLGGAKVGQEVLAYRMPDQTYTLGLDEPVRIVQPYKQYPRDWVKVSNGAEYTEMYQAYVNYADYWNTGIAMALSCGMLVGGILGGIRIIGLFIKLSHRETASSE